jgi:hypothetical protein
MGVLSIALALAATSLALADTITLKNGQVINGTYLGGSPRQVKIEMGDQIQNVDVGDILRIDFGGGAALTQSPAPPPPPQYQAQPAPPPAAQYQPAPPPPNSAGIELPQGTNLVVRTIDGVDSQVNHVGQTFAASLDEPVSLNGQTVIPRGADVVLKLVDAQQSGKFTGRTGLTMDLMSLKVNGRMVDVNTQTVSRESSSRGKRTAEVAGGTAALGAIIGAIAGGGKGAAIGAGAGGAAGAGAEVVTSGQRVKIPSETRLTFTLDTPVRF